MTFRKLFRLFIILVISAVFAIAASTINPSYIQARAVKEVGTNSLSLLKKKTPDFSGDGRPGRRIGGGSRYPCPAVKLPLTALMPETNWGKTISTHPSFGFYVPYSSEQVNMGEFVLQKIEGNDVYRMRFTLPKASGIVSLNVPSTKAPLETNKLYRWYFKLYCGPQQSSTPVFVEGWVQRVTMTSEVEKQLQTTKQAEYAVYTDNNIWYDAIAHLLELRLAYPLDAKLDRDWMELLSSKGVNLQSITKVPIAGKLSVISDQ
jgi:hypothetical protein